MAIISDFVKTRQYQAEFEKAGLKISPESRWSWGTFPPLRVIKATKNVSVTDSGASSSRELRRVENLRR